MGLFGKRGKDPGFHPSPPQRTGAPVSGPEEASEIPAVREDGRASDDTAPWEPAGSGTQESPGMPLPRGAGSVGAVIESGSGPAVLAREAEIRALLPLLDEDGLWAACQSLREAADEAEGAADALADIPAGLDEGLAAAVEALNDAIEWQRDAADPGDYPRCQAVADARGLLGSLSFSAEALAGILGLDEVKRAIEERAEAAADEARRLGTLADDAEAVG